MNGSARDSQATADVVRQPSVPQRFVLPVRGVLRREKHVRQIH
ncbi:MAG: hypothetical protein ACYC3X_29035 [Pirellulaceae bacterium]